VVERAGWFGPVLAVTDSAILVTAMVPRTVLAAAGGLLLRRAARGVGRFVRGRARSRSALAPAALGLASVLIRAG
jgi:hypothetical protein